MNSWYKITAQSETEYEVHIYEEIGFWGITAKQFIDDFKKIPAEAKIKLRINSPGGDVFDSIAIYNVIKRHPGTVEGTVDGIAASGASVIAMAANPLAMPENSFLMIHNSSGLVWGNAEDMRDWADVLAKIDAGLVATYVSKSGQTAEKISELMGEETWLSAAEAKDLGLADEVIAPVKLAARADLNARFKKLPQALRVDSDSPASDPPAAQPPSPAAVPDPAATARAESKHIAELCAAAGVPDLAAKFIGDDMTAAQVEARLKAAPDIRALCVAAKLPARADAYIKAGLSIDEVRKELFDILAARDPVVIDNHLGPDANQKTTVTTIDVRAIYDNWRSPKSKK